MWPLECGGTLRPLGGIRYPIWANHSLCRWSISGILHQISNGSTVMKEDVRHAGEECSCLRGAHVSTDAPVGPHLHRVHTSIEVATPNKMVQKLEVQTGITSKRMR